MSRSKPFHLPIILFSIFFALLIFCGITWGNVLYAQNNGLAKDFFVPWLTARTFLEYGDSPYSDPASQRSQILYYGQLASESEDPLHLWVPFPGELFYFPFALIQDYDLARGLWLTLCEMALISATILSMKILDTKPTRILLISLLLFQVLWVFSLLNLVSSSPTPFLLLAALGSLLALRNSRDEIAGVLLVIPLFSPGVFGVFILYILWWTIYHRRWRVVMGFLMSLGIFLLLSFLLLPDWIVPFIRGIYWHLKFNPGLSTLSLLGSLWPVVGPRLGWLITIFAIFLLFSAWRGSRRGNFDHLLWTACLTLSITPLLGFFIGVNEYSVLSFPLFLLITIISERWRGGKLPLTAVIVLFLAWTITWALVAFVTPWMSLVVPILLTGGLLWMKWWVVRPPRTVFESWK